MTASQVEKPRHDLPNLPAELQAALARKAEGCRALMPRSRAISQTYRSGGSSSRIRTRADALAYALARMPGTYAAVAASLNALMEIDPDFAPLNLLDIGADREQRHGQQARLSLPRNVHAAGREHSAARSRNRSRHITAAA
jgi:hypothetical protein